MKLTFTAPELAWLNHYINQLIIAAGRMKNLATMAAAARMRNKFHGGTGISIVNLNKKERVLIYELTTHRLERLGNTSLSDEVTLLEGIVSKLGVE